MSDMVNIKLLNKKYQFKCPENENANRLHHAALYLNNMMETIQDNSKTIDFDGALLMSTINITADFLEQKKKLADTQYVVNDVQKRVAKLRDKIQKISTITT